MTHLLINIIEYLALEQIETQIAQEFPHQELFADPIERLLILQGVLNQMPPVYRWIDQDKGPGLSHLEPDQRDRLHQLIRQEIHWRLQRTSPHHDPYAESMPELFYG